MAELDLTQFPLRGRQLIEASAGTGKTYGITALHLRALLGHGTPVRSIEQILLVTFTEAATSELRERVRERVRGALQVLTGPATSADRSDPPDRVVEQILNGLPDRADARRRLTDALYRLDEAPIYTIHGFCLRALRDWAFESGASFEQEFLLDDTPYWRTAVTDVWRQWAYAADSPALLLSYYSAPDVLWDGVRQLLRRDHLQWLEVPKATLPELLDLAQITLRATQQRCTEIALESMLSASNLSKAKVGPAGANGILALQKFLATDFRQALPEPELKETLALFSSVKIQNVTRLQKGEELRSELFAPLFDAALACLADVQHRVLYDTVHEARKRAHADKQRRQVLSADDVLHQMDAALQGVRGGQFAVRLRERYSLAMIDEFQDTDPVQWRVFDAIYPQQLDAAGSGVGGGAGEDAHMPACCVLIGDPKQAIYGFRGADVFSYLNARARIPKARQHAMSVTYRASPGLTVAMNTLYGRGGDFAIDDIRYHALSAGRKDGTFASKRKRALAPLNFWHLPVTKALTKRDLRARMSTIAAARIAGWLTDGSLLLDGRALKAADVAVLVRDRHEARFMREALAARGLGVAYLSPQNVYQSEAAVLLRWLLEAVLRSDEALIRGVLLSDLGGWSTEALVQSLSDETLWGAQVDRFRRYQQLWRSRGLLTMLQRFMADYELPARWLSSSNPEAGQRRLTDLRHLGELLQRRSAHAPNAEALLRLLRDKADAGTLTPTDESEELRLDTDAALIRLLTMHGAKGLQFGVVVLPFVCSPSGGKVNGSDPYHEWDMASDSYRNVLRWGGADDARQRQEALAEDLRLLYVALTRAQRACYVGVALSETSQQPFACSALGHLLFNDPELSVTTDVIQAKLDELSGASKHVAVEAVDDPAPPQHGQQALSLGATLAARPFKARIPRSWQFHSYSSLVLGAGGETVTPGTDESEDVIPVAPTLLSGIRSKFPRGARAGSCLHAMLEAWPQHNGERSALAGVLRSFGFASLDAEASAVAAWLNDVRASPLPPLHTHLAERQLVIELEFHLPLRGRTGTQALRRVLDEFGYRSDSLPERTLHGMLKGYIDAIFVHDGLPVIVDYKSNFLGNDLRDYGQSELRRAIADHHYDLQFLIYAVAVRRWLGLSSAPHVLYLFLRGMDGRGSGVFHHQPEPAALDALDALFDGGDARRNDAHNRAARQST